MPGMTEPAVAERIVALRRRRLTGNHIAMEIGVLPATVSRVLKRAGLSRLKDIEPAEPIRRYEREHPGEMIHIDIKKLGRFSQVGHRITGDPQKGKSRGPGWEFVHVCIDEASLHRLLTNPARQEKGAPPSPSSRRRSPITPASAFRQRASRPTTAPATDRRLSPRAAAISA
jgi:hypothetical protein